MSSEKREAVRQKFNDAAREGGALRLRIENNFVEIVPLSLENVFGGGGTFVRVDDPNTIMSFDAAHYGAAEAIGAVQRACVTDPAGAVVKVLTIDLNGYRCRFEICGLPKGDVYRVEVAPDQTVGGPKEIPQIDAGVHTSKIQSFDVALSGCARSDYMISIHKVDAQTAKRDRNVDAPKLWEAVYKVAQRSD